MKTAAKRVLIPLCLGVFLVSCVSQRKTGNSSSFSESEDTSSSSSSLEEQPKVLVLTDYSKFADESEKVTFQKNFLYAADYYSLYDSGNLVFQGDLSSYPTSLAELNAYDRVILSDVDVSKVTNRDLFLSSLQAYVKEEGKPLFTFGNVLSLETDSSAEEDTEETSSSFETTPLVTASFSDLLPLKYDYSYSNAVCFLIDNSGSMDSDNRMLKAKQGAIACLDFFSDNDFISVVTFSDTANTVQSLTSATDKEAIASSINKIKSEGGTELIPGLKAASNQLSDAETDYKSILLLSDGDPFEAESTIMKQVRRIVASGVSISTINIANNSSASIALLKKIASTGNGSYTYCSTASSLVSTMKENIREGLHHDSGSAREGDLDGYPVSLKDSSDASLKGISSLPVVYGFDAATGKEGAKEVLSVSYSLRNKKEKSSSEEETSETPLREASLFATWEQGKGFVSSFASSLGRQRPSQLDENGEVIAEKKSWSESFFSSDSGGLFLRQALRENLKHNK